jgi:creatinine amidohydrolase/Fe(II)-dependent formamide hydrolase-like protein
VVAPPLHWGTHGTTFQEDFKRSSSASHHGLQPPGSVYISEGLLIALLLEMFREIEYAGFKVIVCLTGHYPKVQVDCCKAAAAQFMNTRPVKVWALCEPELSGAVEVGRDHAGKWETSLLWALRPDLVDMSRCKADEKTGRWLFSSPKALEATRELGEKTAQCIADQLGRRAKELLIQGK